MSEAYLEPSEVEAMEAQATNLRDQLIIRMSFRLGCRVSELLGIGRQDVDRAAGGVRIERLKQRLKLHCPKCDAPLSRRSVFCPGCGQKVAEAVQRESEKRRVRFLRLDPETMKMLGYYLDHSTRATDRVFPITRWRVWGIVRECARRAGLGPLINPDTGKRRGVSPHRLRDAFAVHALKVDDTGEGMRLLQEQLGHERFDTTARYRKVSGAELDEWQKKLWEKPTKEPGRDSSA